MYKKSKSPQETEAKFDVISKAIRSQYGDGATFILYTPEGLMIHGDALGVASTYRRCDPEMQAHLKRIAREVADEVVERITNGDDTHCDNPECPVHGEGER